VRWWTTLNEPWCSAYLGYGTGEHAPGRTDPRAALHAAHHLLLGHGLAVTGMRAATPARLATNKFGITLNLWPVTAVSESDVDREAARRVDGISNRFFLDPLLRGGYPADVLDDVATITDTRHVQADDEQTIAVPLDVLGVNYYSPVYVRGGVQGRGGPWIGCDDVEPVPQGLPTSDMGWEIEPDGLYRLLRRLADDYPQVPLYVTENGIALPDVVDANGRVDDPERIRYIDTHLRACVRAIDDGVDLRGYFVWSLIDNFEWAFGYSKRFGLVHVDTATQVRTPKASASWYADVTRTRELP
jgi:beta-glucosidase